MKNRLELLQSKLAKMNLTGLPIYITQWNSNNIPGFLPRDCVQNAAYIVKNICDNYPVVESFGYWILSDEKEEYFANNVPFHGGMGLISNFGFKMPGYHAMEFFAKMRGKLLYRQDGIFITKDQDDVYALLYHYIHFRANVCENNAFNERYRYFEDRPSKTISIVFDGLQEGNYMISEHIINQEYASCFDIWVNMGGPDHLTREDVQYINDMNRPARNISYQKIAGKWELNRVLKRFEVRLVILKCQK
jgi:xylan 1,4-beta-xylosidase